MTQTLRRRLAFLLATVALPAAGLIVFQSGTTLRQRARRAGRAVPPRGVLAAQEIEIIPGDTKRERQKLQPAAGEGESWQVIYLGEKRIGYSRTRIESDVVDTRAGAGAPPAGWSARVWPKSGDFGPKSGDFGYASETPVVRTLTETSLLIRRFGEPTRMRSVLTTVETRAGELISFELESENGPRSRTRTRGRVVGRRVVLEVEGDGRRDAQSVPCPEGVKSPVWPERLAHAQPLEPGDFRRFHVFLPQEERIREFRVSAGAVQSVTLPDGRTRRLLKVTVAQSGPAAAPVEVWLDENGRTVMTETDFLHRRLVTWTVPAGEALRAIQGEELDLGVSMLVRVKAIPHAHDTKRIVYRIRMPDDDPAKHFPAGPTQQVRSVRPDTIELTVTAPQFPESRLSARVDRRFLDPSSVLPWRDRRVMELARRADPYETNPARLAVKLEQYVHRKMAAKNFSTAMASAADVARSLEGDCTEHAVLLAAVLRARGVPSRIAVGLVYNERQAAFGGHMWTEAHVGEVWVPLDATLGRGGIGAAHIKLGDASLADNGPSPLAAFVPLMNVLGRIEMAVVEVESNRPVRSQPVNRDSLPARFREKLKEFRRPEFPGVEPPGAN